jgi:hypothetical protein
VIKQAPHKRWPKDQQLRWKNDEKCRETAKKRKTGLDKDQAEKEKERLEAKPENQPGQDQGENDAKAEDFAELHECCERPERRPDNRTGIPCHVYTQAKARLVQDDGKP